MKKSRIRSLSSSKKRIAFTAVLVIAVFFLVAVSLLHATKSIVYTPLVNQPDLPVLFDATDGSTDYLHMQIPANPVLDPHSSVMVAGANWGTRIPGANLHTWAFPIYSASSRDPVYFPLLKNAAAWGCSVGPNGIHIPSYGAIAAPAPPADNWIVTVNKSTDEVIGIWQGSKATGTWTGNCAGDFPLHGNGFNLTAGVGVGAGSAPGAGVVLIPELQSGTVSHALFITAVNTCTTRKVPATKSDGKETGTGCFPEGARIQLNPSVNCTTLPGATAGEKTICHTLQTYGAYILDSSTNRAAISFQGDDMTDPNRQPWQIPGNGIRGTRNCAPVSLTCGAYANVGLVNVNDFSQIPWTQVRVLNQWNGL